MLFANPDLRVFATCISCRVAVKKSTNKKRALHPLDPNIQPAKLVCYSSTGPQPTVRAPLAPNLPAKLPLPNPPTEPQPPQAPVTALPPTEPTGFLPTDEWRQIQDFNKAMETASAVKSMDFQWT